jgi:multidrug resistance protein
MPLTLIMALRFFGLFVVFPVLSIHVLSLPNSSLFLAGLAVGGFALTQMLLQVPFGLLSDRIGRKETMFLGLSLFAIGSIVCAMAEQVEMLLIGRLLQGAGAIGGVISATISDLVNEEKRSKAMAIMGAGISMSFVLAMIFGPLLSVEFGIEALFWVAAVGAIVSIVLLVASVPKPPQIEHAFEEMESKWHEVLKDHHLLRMNISNFLQKGLMTLTFFLAPILLIHTHGWDKSKLYELYVPMTLIGMLAIPIAVVFAQKKGKYKIVLGGGIGMFALSYVLFGFGIEWFFIIGMVTFFIGFSLHEPILQTLASRYAKAHQRGAALGVFNSFGFFGTFVGGALGGLLLEYFGFESIAIGVVLIALIWGVTVLKMPNPADQKNIYVLSSELQEGWKSVLTHMDGILEYYTNTSEQTVIVKYDDTIIKSEQIRSKIMRDPLQNSKLQ